MPLLLLWKDLCSPYEQLSHDIYVTMSGGEQVSRGSTPKFCVVVPAVKVKICRLATSRRYPAIGISTQRLIIKLQPDRFAPAFTTNTVNGWALRTVLTNFRRVICSNRVRLCCGLRKPFKPRGGIRPPRLMPDYHPDFRSPFTFAP